MRRTPPVLALVPLLLLALAACGAPADDPGDDDPPGELRGVALPQALGGALAANPAVYPTIPVRVAVDGDAELVTVSVAGATTVAAPGPDGHVAAVPIAGLADGTYALEARAIAGAVERAASAELVVGRAGRQVTAVAADGHAGTPRLVWLDGRLHLTWTDGRDGRRKVRIAELDGAGRFVAAPRVLFERADDVLYARTAVGAGAIGVLFQERGGPYTNGFAVVAPDGAVRVAPIALDPDGMYGSSGGDVAFDGEAFVLVWRVNDGAGASHVRWMRVTPDGAVTGPVVVAAPGDGDPDGGFQPFTRVAVAPVDGGSVVAFVRDRWDATLELHLPACQLVPVSRAGEVGATQRARDGWVWHHDCRLLDGGAGPLLLWGEQSLTDPSDTPPTSLRAAALDAGGVLDPARGPGAVVVTGPDHRTEPALAGGVLAWLDERSYQQLDAGRIELWVAPLAPDLAAGTAVVFGHARFIEGTSELGATSVGPNRLLVWIDERHGGGIFDPRPEVWIDVAWF